MSVKSLAALSLMLCDICWLPVLLLREPGGSHGAQLLLDSPEMLRAVADNHHRLLHGASCDLGRAIDEGARVQLAGTRYAEEARRRSFLILRASERKVRVVFGRSGGSVSVA